MRNSSPRISINILFVTLAVLGAFGVMADTTTAAARKIYVIPAAGEVGPVMAAAIERSVAEALEAKADVIVLEFDTFGGRVDSALKIVDTLVGITGIRTIAFVKNKAISAGALIALACNDLAMRPHTTIGDCAPISFSQDGPKMMGEKFQSPLRAKFRALARRNNYPVALAEAMVTDRLEVYEIQTDDGEIRYLEAAEYRALTETEKKKVVSAKVVVAEDELLTMDDVEAHKLGFSRMTADSIDDMLGRFDLVDYQIVRLTPTWSEKLGGLISAVAPFLMMIGLAGLYTEFKSPGFGVPGLIGILCLGLVFGNQYIVGLASYPEMILIALGIVLLGFEIFVIPGFGIAGVSGFILIGLGMLLSFQDFVVPDPNLPWQQGILLDNLVRVSSSFVVAVIGGLVFINYGLPRLGRVVEGPYLDTTLSASHADSHEAGSVKAGDTGVAATFLRPAGKARFGKRDVDVLTEGDFVNAGEQIRVLAVKGNRVVVARLEK